MTDLVTTPPETTPAAVETLPFSRALNAGLRRAMAEDDHVVLTGAAEWEFSGTFDPATGAWARDAESAA